MDLPSHIIEQRVKSIFNQARQVPLEPSSFLKARVLAHVRETASNRVGLHWKIWAMASSAVSLVLLAVLFWPIHSSLTAMAKQRVLVRVEVKALVKASIAYAKVELPEGVSFVSTQYPDIEKLREVTVAWMPEFENKGLPFVVQALSAGKKTIQVLLFDRDHTAIKSKEITITFQESV